jgi:hypothetical protein
VIEPVAILKLWMIVTALTVAPFHRFAAVYVGCYAAAVLIRDFGMAEVFVNFIWHGAAFMAALCFPVMRSRMCKLTLWLFPPLLFVDALRILKLADPYYGWWAVFCIVCAQLSLLHLGVDSEARRSSIRHWMDDANGRFFRMRAA